MISIVNIDRKPRPGGAHSYCLRVNLETILFFAHDREDGLAECLRQAANAVERKANEAKGDT